MGVLNAFFGLVLGGEQGTPWPCVTGTHSFPGAESRPAFLAFREAREFKAKKSPGALGTGLTPFSRTICLRNIGSPLPEKGNAQGGWGEPPATQKAADMETERLRVTLVRLLAG